MVTAPLPATSSARSRVCVCVAVESGAMAQALQTALRRLGYRTCGWPNDHRARPDLLITDADVEPGLPTIRLDDSADATDAFASLATDFTERELQLVIEANLERQRHAKRLLDQERLLAATLESLGDAVVATDASGAVTFVNGVAQMLTGWSLHEALGLPIEAVLCLARDGTRQPVELPIRRAMRAKAVEPMSSHVLLPGRGGRAISIDAAAAPLFDGAGAVSGGVLVFHDASERRLLEDQFRQAQKMEAVGRLASGVAHDFNNLLTVIGGYSSLMLETMPAGDENREAVAEIHEAGERAANLTRQLLAFSRQQLLAPVVLNLNEVVSHAGRLLQRLIGEDVAVTLRLEPALWRAKADAGQLEQVLMNLAVNARDAMPDGGRLTIATANAVEHGVRVVRLTVRDTGCGMAEEVKARIFEPFFTTKPAGKGTGLGLPMVYGFVAQSGGRIAVESELSVGTTIAITLPAVEGDTSDAPAESFAAVPQARGDETILLVEDDPSVRQFAQAALQLQGYGVVVASRGAEAIALAHRHADRIQLVLTDVVMPEMGGKKLVDALRADRPELKVLYMSGYLDEAVVQNGVAQGADQFLHKPFTPIALAKKVRSVLDGSP